MSLAERLAAALGAGAVEAAPERLAAFSVDGLVPSCVVTPPSLELLGRTVAIATQGGAGLLPRGNGTHVHVGNPPARFDVALSTRGLNRILRHDAADMTVAVEAGVTLDQLAAVLRPAGQWLPLDPPMPSLVTVGGLLAADLNGGLRFSHGKARDYLLGVRAVIGGGTVIHGGGEVVKNVAGYDLPKLLIGSFGSLGVIAEATFKVRPLPASDVWLAWPGENLAAVAGRALALLDAPIAPYALDLCDASAAAELGLPRRPHVLVRLGGEGAEVRDQRDRLAALLPACDEIAAPAGLRDFSLGGAVSCRLSLLPSDLPPVLVEIEREARSFAVDVRLVAHAGSGIGRLRVEGESAVPFLRWLRFVARQRGGHMMAERLPPEQKRGFDVWGDPTVPLALLRRVKAALDPTGVLSPGRFVGGL